MTNTYPWSIEELAAAIAVFSHANVKSTKGGQALRDAMAALLDPNDLTRDTIQKLGLQPYDDDGGLRPLSDLIGQIEQANPAHQDYWRLFGIQAGSTMSQLVQYGSETIRHLANRVVESEDSEQLLSDTARLVGMPPGGERPDEVNGDVGDSGQGPGS
ncbi:MAG: phage tail tape measure protein [Chloroflexota bacterium]